MGEMWGWGGRQRQRDRDTDTQTGRWLDLHSWELVGSGVGRGQPEPPPNHSLVPPEAALGSDLQAQHTGFCCSTVILESQQRQSPATIGMGNENELIPLLLP